MKNLWNWFLGLFTKPREQHDNGIDPHTAPKELHQIKVDPAALSEVPWLTIAKTMLGKKETDTAFAKQMIPFWKRLFGRSLNAIAGDDVAWCGLFVGRCLYEAGMPVQKKGEMAGSWRSYGVSIDWQKNGIPAGSVIHINHNFSCAVGNSGNHVTFAAVDHTAEDLLKRVGTFFAIGGNQGNRVCIAQYGCKEICEVRWPKEYPFPAPVLASGKINAEKAGSTQ